MNRFLLLALTAVVHNDQIHIIDKPAERMIEKK